MNQVIIGILIGLLAGLIIFPIGLGIYLLIKNTLERRSGKRMLRDGKILTPIDTKDYDSKQWTGKKYGNIDVEAEKKVLEGLDEQIFKKKREIEQNGREQPTNPEQ